MTWNTTAELRNEEGAVLARYAVTGWFGRHEYEVHNFGVIKAERIGFGLVFNYKMDGRVIGMIRNI